MTALATTGMLLLLTLIVIAYLLETTRPNAKNMTDQQLQVSWHTAIRDYYEHQTQDRPAATRDLDRIIELEQELTMRGLITRHTPRRF